MQNWVTMRWINSHAQYKDKNNKAKTSKRFYNVFLQTDIFGAWQLIKVFGRVGTKGRIHIDNEILSYDHGLKLITKISKKRKSHHYIQVN